MTQVNQEVSKAPKSVTIDGKRLTHFFVRSFAGLGIINVWLLLLVLFAGVCVYAISLISNWGGFAYLAAVLLVPVLMYCWWACYFLSLDFLSEIGVELNGAARFVVAPIAIPVACLSFIVSIWVSAGEMIKSRGILAFSFLLGVLLTVAIVVAFVY